MAITIFKITKKISFVKLLKYFNAVHFSGFMGSVMITYICGVINSRNNQRLPAFLPTNF